MTPIPVTACSNAWVCGSPVAGIEPSNPAVGMVVLSLVNAVCCNGEVSASGRSIVEGLPTDSGFPGCDQL